MREKGKWAAQDPFLDLARPPELTRRAVGQARMRLLAIDARKKGECLAEKGTGRYNSNFHLATSIASFYGIIVTELL